MRENCTKIYITSKDKEYMEEFKNEITHPTANIIVIDMPTHTQQKLDLSQFNHMNVQDFCARLILTNPNLMPSITRNPKRKHGEFITINTPGFDEFQTRIPNNFFNNIKKGKKLLLKKNVLNNVINDREKIKEGEKNAVGNSGKKEKNVRWDLLLNQKQ
jgi:hypothetical protein